MKKTKKIILCIIMLVTVCTILFVPTFASTFGEGNSIVYRGHYVSGTSYKANDIVMYNGTLYKCLIGNAVFDPTMADFWTIYDSTNYDTSADYNKGYDDGYGVGKLDGAGDGYNKGYDDGYQEGFDFGADLGLEEGYNNGYADGYADGYDDGVKNTLKETSATIGHYNGAIIDIYAGLNPSTTDIPIATEHLDSFTNPERIFDFLNLSLIGISDEVKNDGFTVRFRFRDAVDFVSTPFQIQLQCEKGYEFDLTKYITVSFHSPTYGTCNKVDAIYNDVDGVYIYMPTVNIEWADWDLIDVKVDKGLMSALRNTSFSETSNTCFVTNKPSISIINTDVLRDYFINGYDVGHNEGIKIGEENGYTNGYNIGYNLGYNEGFNGGNGFMGLFEGISSVPTMVLSSLFGFEVFGINIMTTLCGILGILVIVWVIKRFI